MAVTRLSYQCLPSATDMIAALHRSPVLPEMALLSRAVCWHVRMHLNDSARSCCSCASKDSKSSSLRCLRVTHSEPEGPCAVLHQAQAIGSIGLRESASEPSCFPLLFCVLLLPITTRRMFAFVQVKAGAIRD